MQPAFVYFLTASAGLLLHDTRAAPDIIAPSGDRLTLFDAYLAEAALTTPLYRVNQPAVRSPTYSPSVASSARRGLSPLSPVDGERHDELTREERADLLRDPKFHSDRFARTC